MATIASNSAAPAAAPFAASGSNGASAPGTPAANDSSSFMRLVTGMIQGNTTPDQLPSNLVEFLLTGDGTTLEGLDAESSADDEDSEELDALEALLGGLPMPGANGAAVAGSGGSSAGTSIGAAGRRGEALQSLLGAYGAGGAAGAADAAGEGALGVAGGAGALGLQDAAGLSPEAALMAALDDAATAASNADGAGSTQQSNSASPMQNLLAAHRAAEGAPQAASAEVRTPVGSQAWADEIGTHLTMMAANGREAASLRLSPEHLGPLEVRISMKDGEASIVFGASNPDTRSALEQSLPRLREMFASQGLVLGDANVSRDAPRDSFKPATFANASRGSSDAGVETDVRSVTLNRVGLVDTYV
jgi:flagellar hook-length control protein FliK